eukprot:gene9741-11376_t
MENTEKEKETATVAPVTPIVVKPTRSDAMVSASANGMTQPQQEAVKTFEHLLRKSQMLFVGLRDLPQFGRQWQPFFQKTFELYTKQQYRAVLEDKAKYGLKRCEIGEIASKIGQLYYHYYLRTSDTNYLNESYIFYEAIRLRSYFKDVSLDTKMPDMMVKQLRYYARFIVVCLLLNKKKVVFELVEELFKHVGDYNRIYKPSDAHEWTLVLQEIFSFLQADQCLSFTDSNGPLQISHRLNIARSPPPPPAAGASAVPTESVSILQQAILVGNHQNQIKFSEITLDMFRMTQSLEYETPELRDPSEKRPFFLIIDSQSSQVFSEIPPFDQPFVSLLSPSSTPKKILSNSKRTSPFGNLFTFFLHDPLGAICDITSSNKISSKSLASYHSIIQSTVHAITKLLYECPSLHASYSFFLMDDFLRSFIARFILCHHVFSLHKDFQSTDKDISYQVSCKPALPSSILTNASIQENVRAQEMKIGSLPN